MSVQHDAMLAIVNLVSGIFEDEQKHIRQRSDTRYAYHAPVTLGAQLAGAEFVEICPAWALDISYNGMGLLAEQEFAPGERLQMRFTDLSKEQQTVTIKVMFSARVLPGTHRLGVVFEFE